MPRENGPQYDKKRETHPNLTLDHCLSGIFPGDRAAGDDPLHDPGLGCLSDPGKYRGHLAGAIRRSHDCSRDGDPADLGRAGPLGRVHPGLHGRGDRVWLLTVLESLPTPLAILIGLLAALLVGLVNGLLVSKMGINPFIATLGMQITVRGLTLVLASGKAVLNLPDSFTSDRAGSPVRDPVSRFISCSPW